MHTALESPDRPEAIALIADLDACQDALYPQKAATRSSSPPAGSMNATRALARRSN